MQGSWRRQEGFPARPSVHQEAAIREANDARGCSSPREPKTGNRTKTAEPNHYTGATPFFQHAMLQGRVRKSEDPPHLVNYSSMSTSDAQLFLKFGEVISQNSG